MISVIMSIYHEKYDWIYASVNSILKQTYTDLELIIIIDNPELSKECKDFLKNIVRIDKRVKVFFNEDNIGLAKCMNIAIQMAEGQYIARMDADDISQPNRLECELDFLNKTGADLVSCQVTLIDESGNKISDQRRKCNNAEICLPYVNYIVHPTVLAKKKMLKDLGGYRNFRTSQDYDLWLRVLSSGYRIEIMEEILFEYRVNIDNISNKKGLEQFLTSNYQRKLYYLRKKGDDKDNYSEKAFCDYLRKKKLSEKKNKKFIYAREQANLFIEYAKKHHPGMIKYFFCSIISFPEYLLGILVRVICMNIKLRLNGAN